MPIHWGTKGFSLNVDLAGNHVAVCFGYPPDSVYKQSVYTALMGRGGITSKTAIPEDVVTSPGRMQRRQAYSGQPGANVKRLIDHKLSEQELTALLSWCEKVAASINEHGLKERPAEQLRAADAENRAASLCGSPRG